MRSLICFIFQNISIKHASIYMISLRQFFFWKLQDTFRRLSKHMSIYWDNQSTSPYIGVCKIVHGYGPKLHLEPLWPDVSLYIPKSYLVPSQKRPISPHNPQVKPHPCTEQLLPQRHDLKESRSSDRKKKWISKNRNMKLSPSWSFRVSWRKTLVGWNRLEFCSSHVAVGPTPTRFKCVPPRSRKKKRIRVFA